ncbi:MAG: hypothetical protein QNJ65_16470 [Xenococcaceae cyanobacterium MO_234.B1]|nr:hypothetical protein [Xenococcaceae cyanobacterium MO_234.B1]
MMELSNSIIHFHRKYRPWIYLGLAVIICLILLVKPALAHDILENSVNQMRETQEWWDDLWQDTFAPDPSNLSGNISIYSFTRPVRFLVGIGLIFWLFDYGKKVVNSRGMAHTIQIFTESLVPILLIVLFLANQGFYSRLLAYGLRDVVNSWSEGVLEQQILGEKLGSALKEQLLAESVKNEVRQQAEKCWQMPRPEVILPSPQRPATNPDNPLTIEQDQAYQYLECLDKLVLFIQEQEAAARRSESCEGGCAWFVSFMKALDFAVSQSRENEIQMRTNDYNPIDPLGTIDPLERDRLERQLLAQSYRTTADVVKNLEKKGWMYVFTVVQWLWMSFLEMSMWLLGLFAPLFVALALIPGKQNMFVFWLIEFLSIGLAKLAYIALIGIVAVQISTETSTVILSQDQRFFMALGVFAPGVSFAVVTSGAIAAATSFRNQSIGAISTGVGIASGSIATVIYSISRYADKKRSCSDRIGRLRKY